MKLSITMPDGRRLYFEITRREPMSFERFQTLCLLIGILGGASLFVYLLTSSVR